MVLKSVISNAWKYSIMPIAIFAVVALCSPGKFNEILVIGNSLLGAVWVFTSK